MEAVSSAAAAGGIDLTGSEAEHHIKLTQSYSGPLPPPIVLRGYDELVPGTASQMIDAHVRGENAIAGSMDRISRAEAFSVRCGAIVGPAFVVGGTAAAVGLLLAGYPEVALATLLPATLGAAAQVISIKRSRR